MKNEVKHTAHSSYRCEYHVVFAPKYRRKVIYKTIREDVIAIIKKLCKEMRVEIIEGEACPDHIHLLVSLPPYMSIAQFVGTLKSKSALMIFDRHANLKYKYGSRHFWTRGYFVDTVGRNECAIKGYIKNQLEEDYTKQGLSFQERFSARMECSKPVAEEFFEWVREEQEKNPVPKSMFGAALTYALNQRDWLMNVFLDGRLELSNNRVERAVRPFAIGRKNWLL